MTTLARPSVWAVLWCNLAHRAHHWTHGAGIIMNCSRCHRSWFGR